jgi:hypothetical protein
MPWQGLSGVFERPRRAAKGPERSPGDRPGVNENVLFKEQTIGGAGRFIAEITRHFFLTKRHGGFATLPAHSTRSL